MDIVEQCFKFLAAERIIADFILAQYVEHFVVIQAETLCEKFLLSIVVIVDFSLILIL